MSEADASGVGCDMPYPDPAVNAVCWLPFGHDGPHEAQSVPTAKILRWPLDAVLAPEEWAYWLRDPSEIRIAVEAAADHVAYSLNADPRKLIALANAALPDDDDRKLTHERIDNLRDMMDADETWTGTSAQSFADAVRFLDTLRSYLPPA